MHTYACGSGGQTTGSKYQVSYMKARTMNQRRVRGTGMSYSYSLVQIAMRERAMENQWEVILRREIESDNRRGVG